MERTLSIIKPDATKRNITGSINKLIEESNLRIVGQKKIQLTLEQAKNFYIIHKDKPFYNELIDYMISGPVIVQVLEGENAVKNYRDVMGSTNPENANDNTIRKNFGISVQENSVHGSDSIENALLEIKFFFNDNEIVG
tara:strand:+ start:107 stop:523 length:417 start_codon:yes stop_codon:yes gene_type:complete